MLQLFRSLMICRLREFQREPSALFFVVFFPILVLLCFYFMMGKESSEGAAKDVAVVIESHEGDHEGNGGEAIWVMRAVKGLEGEGYGVLWRSSRQAVVEAVLAQEARFGVVLDRTAGPEQKGPADGEETKRVEYVILEGDSSYPWERGRYEALEFHQHLQQQWGLSGIGYDWTDVHTDPGYENYFQFMVPGFLAFSLFTTCLFGLGMTLVVHRREQLLKRYLTTPMPGSLYILSYIVSRQLIMVLEIVVIVGVAALCGYVQQGSWGLFITLCTLGTLMMSFLSIGLASRTSQASFYNGLANLVVLPMMLFGGVWFSLSSLPEWLMSFAQFLPLSVWTLSLREVSHGGGLGDVWPQMVWMGAYGVIFAAIAHRLFVWYER